MCVGSLLGKSIVRKAKTRVRSPSNDRFFANVKAWPIRLFYDSHQEIQPHREISLQVYTTVGTEEKRQYLKKKFPALQDKHFANSRSADFELHIRHETKGRGVDIVLNSLAQEMLQVSFLYP